MKPFRFSFPKSARMLSRYEFREVKSSGSQFVGKYVIAQWVETKSTKASKLGLIVSRKFGKAHERNRFKRLAREAFRLMQHDWTFPIQLTIRPRSYALRATLHDLQEEFKRVVSSMAPLEEPASASLGNEI